MIVTVSTSRHKNLKEKRAPIPDESGDIAEEILSKTGGVVRARELIPDDADMLKRTVSRALRRPDLDVVVLTGGTGVSTTDVTIETVRPLFEKELEGFGEIFRMTSFQQIGPAAALSRATAGVAKGKLVMCLPGSPNGVKTALELFASEVPHILYLARGT